MTWPHPVVELLRGELDEAALLAAAGDDDETTAARCYLGMDHALRNNSAQAIRPPSAGSATMATPGSSNMRSPWPSSSTWKSQRPRRLRTGN